MTDQHINVLHDLITKRVGQIDLRRQKRGVWTVYAGGHESSHHNLVNALFGLYQKISNAH